MSRKERRTRASAKFQFKQQKAINRFQQKRKKMSKSVEQIQQQYGELCQKAGELQYHIVQNETQLKEINQRIMILNKEFHESRLKKSEEQATVPDKVEEKDVSSQG